MLTKDERKTRPLPTLAELENVEALGQRFHDALEDVACQVEAIDDAWTNDRIAPETLPTHEQIGYLYLFAHYVEMRADEVRDLANKITGALPPIGCIPGDIAAGTRPDA
jgi:hypothetical protein